MIQHIAFIMDGNRRWAREHGIETLYGNESKKAVERALSYCIKHAIPFISLYTFSLENMKRSSIETNYILHVAVETIEEMLPYFIKEEIKISFIGQRELFAEKIMPSVLKLENSTKDFTKLHVSVLFCYGGQQEIVQAVKKIAYKVADKELNPEAITTELYQTYLQTSPVPFPELIIRTGGFKRLSNFLLYQAAYSELYFLDCLWPELTEKDIESCVEQYKKIKKNFGI